MKRVWRQQQGGIYVEALVAIAILAVALVPILGTYAITPAAQRQASGYSAAINIARGRLEALHALTPAEWNSLSNQTDQVTLEGEAFTVIRAVDPPRSPGLRDVRVTVRWTDPKGVTAEITLGTSVVRRP